VTQTHSTFKENNRWIIDNYDTLSSKFKDEWVAVKDLAILDHDKDIKKLVERIKAKYTGDYKQIAVEFISINEEIESVPPDNLWE
jgi:hypothetical protein